MTASLVIKEFKRRAKTLTSAEMEVSVRYSPTNLDVRKISKADFQFLLKDFLVKLPEDKQTQIWLEVYKKSPYRNLDSIAIDFFKLRQKRKSFPLMNYGEELYTWTEKVDCWMTGDMLASLTSQIHEEDPKRFFPKIVKMSNSSSPWLNRMGLLSLFYYSASRKTHPSFEKSIGLVEKHLHKDHYYLQKAVGWTLREMHNVYPKQTSDWIEAHLKDLTSQAFTTATEKIKGSRKESWKNQRKANRKA